MDIDDAWKAVSSRKCGYFQIWQLLLLSFPVIYCAIPALAFIFTAAEIDHRCLIPECETSSDYEYDSDFLKFTIPKIQSNYDKVSRFKPVTSNGVCIPGNFDKSQTQNCDEWVWRPPEYSIHQEWGFTGNAARWNRVLVGTINNIGQFGGYFFIGILSDEIGRKSTLIYACMASSALGFIRSFSPSFSFFLVFEFFDILLAVGVYSCCIVLALEIVGPKMRLFGGALIGCYYAIGEILLGVLASQIFYWRDLLRAISIPASLIVLLNWILPDSIIWLLSRGKSEDAISILYRAARLNHVSITNEIRQSIHSSMSRVAFHLSSNEHVEQKYALKQLLKSKILILRLIGLSFIWISVSLVYYGLSHNSVSLSTGDKYLNYIVVCMIELPGYILLGFLGNFVKRRHLIVSTLAITALVCLSSIFFSQEQAWLMLVLFLVGKLFITITFTLLQVYANELFPTQVRNSCIGFCAMIGQIGSIAAPQTPLMREVWEPLPLVIFGSLTLTSSLISVTFPETSRTRLPATIEEAEKLGEQQIDDFEN